MKPKMHWFEKLELQARAGVVGLLAGGFAAVAVLYLPSFLLPKLQVHPFILLGLGVFVGGLVGSGVTRKIMDRENTRFDEKRHPPT